MLVRVRRGRGVGDVKSYIAVRAGECSVAAALSWIVASCEVRGVSVGFESRLVRRRSLPVRFFSDARQAEENGVIRVCVCVCLLRYWLTAGCL